MKNKILFICLLTAALFVWNSCSEQPTSVLDTQNTNSALSKTVYVPGSDITEQLTNDLNAGLDVNLPAGHFYVSESIVALYYSGTLKGAGKEATIIEAAQGFKALPVWFQGNEYHHTTIFNLSESKGDVTIKNLTILVNGNAPAEEHENAFYGTVNTIDNAIVVDGVSPEAVNGITVTYKNLRIKGEYSNDPLSVNNKNLIYPLITTGWMLSGPAGTGPVNAVIMNCEVENSGDTGIEYFACQGGLGNIKNNEISNSFAGIWLGWGNWDGEIVVMNNRFNNITTVPVSYYPPWYTNNLCIKNNTLDGAPMTEYCQ